MEKEKWFEVPACTYADDRHKAVKERFLLFVKSTSERQAQKVIRNYSIVLFYDDKKIFTKGIRKIKPMPEGWEPSMPVASRYFPTNRRTARKRGENLYYLQVNSR